MRQPICYMMIVILAAVGCAMDTSGYDSTPDPPATAASQRGGETDEDRTDCFESVSAFALCTSCHSTSKTGSERAGAPTYVNLDSEQAASKVYAEVVQAVKIGLMPPRSTGELLSAEEKEEIYAWGRCVSAR